MNGVDFLLEHEITTTRDGDTTTRTQIIGIVTEGWVKVMSNFNSRYSSGWFGYFQMMQAAEKSLAARIPPLDEEAITKEARKLVRAELLKRHGGLYTEMNDPENYLVTNQGGIIDWKELDGVAEELASRFGIAVEDVALMVVVGAEQHVPIPSKQGLYRHNVYFYRTDHFGKELKELITTKQLAGGAGLSTGSLRERLEALRKIIGETSGRFVEKSSCHILLQA